MRPHIHYHTYDLPDSVQWSASVAIDTEAMGLKNHRDRLCLVQLNFGDEHCHLVHFPTPDFSRSQNLKRLLTDSSVEKIFHFARFDVAILQYSFNLMINHIYCTKIASKLSRTYTNKHGLKDLCKELLSAEINKNEQTSDWGQAELSPQQQTYAANDVLHLHALQEKLNKMLVRENRMDTAKACFEFIPHRACFDLWAGDSYDIFSYQDA